MTFSIITQIGSTNKHGIICFITMYSFVALDVVHSCVMISSLWILVGSAYQSFCCQSNK